MKKKLKKYVYIFWNELDNLLSKNILWILSGDWNILEKYKNRKI